jgi:hypothetical protein
MKLKNNKELNGASFDYFTGAIEWCDGANLITIIRICHYKNGKPHNETAPAIEYTVIKGYRLWYLNGRQLDTKLNKNDFRNTWIKYES